MLLPAILGLTSLLLHDAPWVAMSYLVLVGFSQGLAGPVMTAVWAEVYGVESLGATKGPVTTLGVLATAVGPVLIGLVLAAGISFDTILAFCVASALGCVAASLWGRRIALRRLSLA